MGDSIAKYFGVRSTGSTPIIVPNVGRNQLAAMLFDFGCTSGAEIGTERGEFAEILCRANPDCHLYCIDAWENYDGYHDYLNLTNNLPDLYQETVKRLSGYNVSIFKGYSSDVVSYFDDESLDFVYIDANHSFYYVVRDIFEWTKKVKPGGVVAGHDYRKSTHKETDIHVIEAVLAYTKSYRIRPWYVLGSDKRMKGEIRDSSRSWLWQKMI